MLQKYLSYLNLKHDWTYDYNCFTIISKIYKDQLNIEMSELWNNLGGYKEAEIHKNWFKHYNRDIILLETRNWIKIDLTDLKEFDILIFTNKKDEPRHFGMYIGQNRFIHLPIGSTSQITELDDNRRDKLKVGECSGAYRHVKLG